VLAGERAPRGPDLLGRGAGLDAEDVVRVSGGHGASVPRPVGLT
jgi:hypothetical protein